MGAFESSKQEGGGQEWQARGGYGCACPTDTQSAVGRNGLGMRGRGARPCGEAEALEEAPAGPSTDQAPISHHAAGNGDTSHVRVTGAGGLGVARQKERKSTSQADSIWACSV